MNQGGRLKWPLEVVLVALLYVVLARAGQLFAMEPGNVTPVWIPSGVMLALVVIRGRRLLAGVFLGAFLGNAWAYFDPSSIETASRGVLAGSLNGIGDVLCVLIGVIAIERAGGMEQVFRRVEEIRRFLILAVVAGPAVSALFGIGGLALGGFVEVAAVPEALYTWWVGDAVGVLLFTPLIFTYTVPSEHLPYGRALGWERAFMPLVVVLPLADWGLSANDVSVPSAYLVAPLLLWILIRGGLRPALWGVLGLVAAELVLRFHLEMFAGDSLSVASLQMLIAVTVASLLLMGTLFWEQGQRLEVASHEALHDELTGTWNRRSIVQRLEDELGRLERYHVPASIALVDVDRFKEINDQQGHQVGDALLRAFIAMLEPQLRSQDMVGRWGGDEFLIVLAGLDGAEAAGVMERLRSQVEGAIFAGNRLTLSAGVAGATPGIGVGSLIEAADEALYRAKKNGRNRVELSGAETVEVDQAR